jgi:uncharacterized coiled-coil protein SlyX
MKWKGRLAQVQAELDQAKAEKAAAAEVKTTNGLSEEEFNRRVDAKAAQQAKTIAAQADWTNRCNAVVEKGREQFSDFNEKVGDLVKLVDKTDNESMGAYQSLIMAAMETGKAHQLIHHLGSDMNVASRFLSMSPAKMAVELTRLADKMEEKKEEEVNSLLPVVNPPPKPMSVQVGARGSSHTAIAPDDPDRAMHLSDAEWFRRREAQVKERGIR